MDKCIRCEVPIGKLNSIADIFEDEHYRARGNLAELEEDGLGKVVLPGVVPTLSETPGAHHQSRAAAGQRDLRGDARAARS
ncbi:MAG: CoA transferase [Comamonadaceae bacterium]|nr:CoA transferase [Comamonadaceae bacterium]